MALNSLLKNVVTEGLPTANPLKSLAWAQPRKLNTVDPHCVIRPDHAADGAEIPVTSANVIEFNRHVDD